MASKKIFATKNVSNVGNTKNNAGGAAFSVSDEHALAQYVVTSCFNDTFYTTGEAQLDTIQSLANKCSPLFVAKAAVYAHTEAKMKDTPCLLLANLAARGELDLLRRAFPLVISNVKQLRNFVQIVRSGVTGRKSFGSAVRNLIRNWLANHNAAYLFRGSVGTNPTLEQVIKLVHPKPESREKEAFYGWLLGRKYNREFLPDVLKNYIDFQAGFGDTVPDVPFMMLTNLKLSEEQWKGIARKSSWDTVRQNLNTFERHGVFSDYKLINEIADSLSNPENVKKHNVFPYQLLTTYLNVGNVPNKIKNALQDAMETATENVPSFDGDIVVCVDTSGSMGSPITGHRAGSTSVTRCVDVAALIAACVLRQNRNAMVLPFDTQVHEVNINGHDSVMTNAQKLNRHGGGTDCSSPIRHLNSKGIKADVVIMISDNESWVSQYRANSVSTSIEWKNFTKKNPKAKLVCIDLQVGATVQVKDSNKVLNIGGFSDSYFEVIKNFIEGKSTNFVDEINSVSV